MGSALAGYTFTVTCSWRIPGVNYTLASESLCAGLRCEPHLGSGIPVPRLSVPDCTPDPREHVHPRTEAKKAFSCWRRCPPQRADVEGTPEDPPPHPV